jgi:hypothetical protein
MALAGVAELLRSRYFKWLDYMHPLYCPSFEFGCGRHAKGVFVINGCYDHSEILPYNRAFFKEF